MIINMLAHVIGHTFGTVCGRNQREKGFLVSLKTRTSDDEEGYRYIDLLLYAPSNYVQVWKRRRWDVIPVADLDLDDEGDGGPKPGKDYERGQSEWELVIDHDSVWRDGVRNVLTEDILHLCTFNGGDWWKIVPASEIPSKLDVV